jgi:protein-disulfide isomerase
MKLLTFSLLAFGSLLTAETFGKMVGSVMAPVTIQVFSDYQCPHCKKVHFETVKLLEKDCAGGVKLQLVNRDFPLSQHQYARLAARYANAAAKLGLFEAVSDQLFTDQELWDKTGDIKGTVAKVVNATQMTELQKLLASDASLDKDIDADVALGMKAEINQTPTFILNAQKRAQVLPGGATYSMMQRWIEEFSK